jgi:hypothetical protein
MLILLFVLSLFSLVAVSQWQVAQGALNQV